MVPAITANLLGVQYNDKVKFIIRIVSQMVSMSHRLGL